MGFSHLQCIHKQAKNLDKMEIEEIKCIWIIHYLKEPF